MTSKVTDKGSEREAASGTVRAIDLDAGRRAFIRSIGLGSAGAAMLGVGAGLLTPTDAHAQAAITDADIFNFALNLEYLEAEFYLRAAFGRGLADADTTGTGARGRVIGGRKVPFQDDVIRLYAEEIATDEENHVQLIRSVLGDAAVARPTIDIRDSFTAAARAAGLVGPNETFDPYANDVNFLLGAFVFEDVGVTAYAGAAPLITNKGLLSIAGRLLGVEAYHAGEIRTVLFGRRVFRETQAISTLRDSADGEDMKDQGIGSLQRANVVPTDNRSLVFLRSPRQVLNIVYLDPGASQGGFFPQGVNGQIR